MVYNRNFPAGYREFASGSSIDNYNFSGFEMSLFHHNQPAKDLRLLIIH